jgi:RNA polymerase sigma-70 factor (ECF subfamily)
MQSGDDVRSRFESSLTPIFNAVYGAARQMTRNDDDAADLVQEASLRAFRSFHTFEEGTNFKAWFFKILTNLFYEKHRKREREPDTVNLEESSDLFMYMHSVQAGLASESDDPAALVMSKLTEEDVNAAIQALPEEYRVVNSLYFVQDFSYEEIAAMVGCPLGTVRSRLHRGRKALQQALWHLAEDRGMVAAAPAGTV